jgi:6-phosphogluconolactonase (cycloisomerase 2 family)
MFFQASLLLLGATSALASTLFIADHTGNVTATKLSFDDKSGYFNVSGAFRYPGCGAQSSWLTIDSGHGVLYCLDEGASGGLTSHSIKNDGSLVQVDKLPANSTLNGPVAAAIVGEPTEQQALVVANYGGGSVTTFLLESNGKFKRGQDFHFIMPHPGPNNIAQASPHPHHVVVDPTGQYVLVPDLGMDQIHVFSWNPRLRNMTELTPFNVPAGSGPRHAVFWTPSGVACETCPTYLYLVSELSSLVTSYKVTYLPNGQGLDFTKGDEQHTMGHFAILRQNDATPGVNFPAEVAISVSNAVLDPRNTCERT